MQRRATAWLPLVTIAGMLVAMTTACTGSQSTNSIGAPAAATLAQRAPQAPPNQVVPRDLVKTGSIDITVPNPSEAANRAAAFADQAGGRVDSRSENAGTGSNRAIATVVLRIPAAKLDSVLEQLRGLGHVSSEEIKIDDVTSQRVDLDARITALQTSVDRLLGIMRDSKDPDALIKAEEALSKRQADLESLRAQRAALGDQIALSTLTVNLSAQEIGGPGPEQYRGFFGQIHRGWDGLLSAATNLVLLFGLLLPWLGALAVLGGIGYGARRLVKQRRE